MFLLLWNTVICLSSGHREYMDSTDDMWGVHSRQSGLSVGLEGPERKRRGGKNRLALDAFTVWGRYVGWKMGGRQGHNGRSL